MKDKPEPTALEIAHAAYDAAAKAWRESKAEKAGELRWRTLCDAASALRRAQNEYAQQKHEGENA